VGIQRILCLGKSFTGGYLSAEFPVDVQFLGRSEPALDPNFEPDLILDTVPAVHEEGTLQNPLYKRELANFAQVPFVHISSTSVYPSSSDGLLEVDEHSPTGDSESCRRRLDVEEAVLSYRPDALIIRAGGLYGRGRSLPQFLARGRSRFFERGNEIISRIHVHDLCRLVLAAGQRLQDKTAEFYGYERKNLINGVDPNPSTVEETRLFLLEFYKRSDVQKALEREGLVAPADLPSPGEVPGQRKVLSLYAAELIGRFRFPDFRTGFADSILRSESKKDD